jgi:phage terminase small subunit
VAKDFTDKEKLFIKYYVKTRNATEAAKLAGYSEDSARQIGAENLSKPSIRDAIDHELEKIQKKIGIDTETIINELKKIALSDIKKAAKWTEGSVSLIPSDQIPDDVSAAIAEVSQQSGEFGSSVKIKNYDKIRALELLGKHLKMFSDKVEVSGPDGAPLEIKTYVDIIKASIKKK